MDLKKKLSVKIKERKPAVSEETVIVEAPAPEEAPAPINKLLVEMNKLLSTSFVFYFQAHTFHWNVEGPDFMEYHDLFSKVYTQVFDSIDVIAEQIRALDEFPVSSLSTVLELSLLSPTNGTGKPKEMINSLLLNNEIVITAATSAYELAESEKKLGLSNFLQDLIDKHSKIGWMLRASSKGE